MINIEIIRNYYWVFVSAIFMGVLISCVLIFLSKFQEYMELKKIDTTWFKFVDASWRVVFTVVSIYVAFIMPIDLLSHYLKTADNRKDIIDLYYICFVLSCVLSCFVFIKLGKIRIKNK